MRTICEGRRIEAGRLMMTENWNWAVYRCDKIARGRSPQNEVMVAGGFVTAGAAMDAANAMARKDRAHSYTVGAE